MVARASDDSKIAETKEQKKYKDQLLESALEHYQKAIDIAEKMDSSGLNFKIFPLCSYITVCKNLNKINDGEAKGSYLKSLLELEKNWESIKRIKSFTLMNKDNQPFESWKIFYKGDWVKEIDKMGYLKEN